MERVNGFCVGFAPQKLSDVRRQGLWLHFSDPRYALAVAAMQACKAGDGTAGRRLTISDARVGYRLSGFRPGLVPVLTRASARNRPRRVCGSSPPWPRPQPCTTDLFVVPATSFPVALSLRMASCLPWLRGQWLDVTRNIPQECANLPSYRNNSDGLLLTSSRQAPVASAQTCLRLPCDVPNYLWQS